MATAFGEKQLTLGEFIEALTVRSRRVEDLENHRVQFDFAYLRPTNLASYRGYYDHLAIGFADHRDCDAPLLTQFITELREANGKVFCGYKGGEYRMGPNTPLWVSNYGEAGNTVVAGVISECSWMTVIETAWQS